MFADGGSSASLWVGSRLSIGGDLLLQSEDKFYCDDIPRNAVKGSYTCNGNKHRRASHTLSAGAIAGIAIACLALILVVLGILFRRWRRGRSKGARQVDDGPPPPQKDDGWRAWGDDKSTEGLTDSKDQGEVVALQELGKRSTSSEAARSRQQGFAGRQGEVHELPTGPTGAAFELSATASRPSSARGG